ncbi:TFIIB-type zinc ribbon-containing protein [Actinokineospora baliensis]|uniref:TFIIB-type zinc ribbon-containing protein n=1 Tax=Actinokineospora baliensis TaxID=547056 RepID=UPI00195DCC46|nr:zf-TFIIB domain-containing protein [Actinokineospora baliensis]
MICPKCQNVMRTVDRLGVHIDQCDGCRGIFLDRGELEQIAAAEQRHYTAAAPPPPYQGAPPPPAAYPAPAQYPPQNYGHGYRDSPPGYRDSPPGYGHHGGHGGHYGHKKRRKSFLEDLFD